MIAPITSKTMRCKRELSPGRLESIEIGVVFNSLQVVDRQMLTAAGGLRRCCGYLYVAFVRTSSSRCCEDSTIDANAGPPIGFALKLSRMAAFTLSRASAFAPR